MFWKKKIRYQIHQEKDLKPIWRLSLALIVSVFFNFLFAGSWIYSFWQPDATLQLAASSCMFMPAPITEERTSSEVLSAMIHMLPEHLIGQLANTQCIENAYMQRDLALGCLVSLHHLDLARALAGEPLPLPRLVKASDSLDTSIQIYPGLSDQQFAKIRKFLTTERWPLTIKGLFFALQQQGRARDPTLVHSFTTRAEFLALQRLFASEQKAPDPLLIVQMLAEGDWQTFSRYAGRILPGVEKKEELRRLLLLEYMQKGSCAAACLIATIEPQFAVKHLDDAALLHLLALLEKTNADSRHFFDLLGQNSRNQVLKHLANQKEEITPALPETTYVIQKGDSLWKIAKRTGLSVALLKKHNNLQTDRLFPGDILHLPRACRQFRG